MKLITASVFAPSMAALQQEDSLQVCYLHLMVGLQAASTVFPVPEGLHFFSCDKDSFLESSEAWENRSQV